MTVKEISKIISGSPPKSCSLDLIPAWLFKSNLDVLASIVISIVNQLLQKGYFLTSERILSNFHEEDIVTPLLKK